MNKEINAGYITGITFFTIGFLVLIFGFLIKCVFSYSNQKYPYDLSVVYSCLSSTSTLIIIGIGVFLIIIGGFIIYFYNQ